MATKFSSVHPFAEIPPVGAPVTHIALADTIRPLLAGTYSLTTALVEVSREGVLTAEEMHYGLVLLAGLLGLADEVMDRWRPDADTPPPAEKEKKP